MNTQKLDVNAILTASIEDQVKITKAAEAAREAFKATQKLNAVKTKAANQVVSTIQKETAKALQNAEKAQQEAYKKTLCELGLSAEAYPLESALLVADQRVAAPVLGFFGKIGKVSAIAGKYIGGKVKAGYTAK